MNLALRTNSCKNAYAIGCIHVETIMDFLRTIKHLVEENDTAIAATQQAIMRVDFLLSRTFQKDAIPSESTSQELTLLFQERRFLQGREESQRKERLLLIQSLCATGASQQAQMQSHQTVLQQTLLTPSSLPVVNSQALIAQHQLMATFDHLNPNSVYPRGQFSDADFAGSGMLAMNLQEKFHVFNAPQNEFPVLSEGAGSFSSRHRPQCIEHLDLSSIALSSPTHWNVQSPILGGEPSFATTTSRQMNIHNEDARDAGRFIIDSSDHAVSSPSSAFSTNGHLLPVTPTTPSTCSKVLLPEFCQEASSKKLFSDVTKANIPKVDNVVEPSPAVVPSPKKCAVRMKSSDGHWREWTDSAQDLSELLGLLKSTKLWNRRFACSTIWSLARPSLLARDLIRDLKGIPLLVSLIAAPSSDDELKRLAAGCIWSICKLSPSNCNMVFECGGVDSICNLLEYGNDDQKCEAIGALRNLGGCSTVIADRIVQCNGNKMLKECMRQDRNSKIREWSARAFKEIMWP